MKLPKHIEELDHLTSVMPHAPLRATVQALQPDGLILVRPQHGPWPAFACEILDHLRAQMPDVGDRVVVMPPEAAQEPGCIMGTVGRKAEGKPKTLELEAEERIELRCGKGSLVLRGDGKVVIRGLEILSASKGRQRIKGASIELN